MTTDERIADGRRILERHSIVCICADGEGRTDHMTRLLDLFCGAGGAAMGYSRAGFIEIVGVDHKPMPRYPFIFVQGDALEYLAAHGHEFDAIHASPPCQGYSIMHNLPWLRGREYPLLILPTMELLERIGRPYVLENVMGARHGAKGLSKRGLEAHGMKAGWLCGASFGLPFYRHRLFATNWLWLAPGHPTHRARIRSGDSLAGRARDIVFSDAEDSRGVASWPGRRGDSLAGFSPRVRGSWERGFQERHPGVSTQARLGGPLPKSKGNYGLSIRPGYEHVPFAFPTLTNWQNGAQAEGVGVGPVKGWRIAAEAMGIDWMTRAELTQAVPPAYTEFIGRCLLTQSRA